MIDDRHHGDHRVYHCTTSGRSDDDVRNGVMDAKEGDDETCQEEENGDVKKGRDSLDNNGSLEAGDTLGKERADAGTLVNCELRLGKTEVSACPALLERR